MFSTPFPCGARHHFRRTEMRARHAPLKRGTLGKRAPENQVGSALRKSSSGSRSYLGQLRRLLPLVEEMTNREVRMSPHHPWPGEPHHLTHPLPLFRPVAVNGTLGTRWFLATVRTAIELSICVVGELRALATEPRAAVVIAVAIHRHHGPNRGPLSPNARWFRLSCHTVIQHRRRPPHCSPNRRGRPDTASMVFLRA